MAALHVVVAGGGTAGHIEPAMNLADALHRRGVDVVVTALGTARGLETTLVPARGYELDLIPAVPMPRKPSPDLVAVGPRVRRAIAETRRILRQREADVVVGFGGYVALPAYLAARREHVPIVVHEANAKAGLANKVGARFTPYVAETVSGSIKGAQRTGLPIRRAVADLDRAATKAEACAFFGLDPDRPILLVFGGSQGAKQLNDAMKAGQDTLRDKGIQVLHAVGSRNLDDAPTSGPSYVAVPYIDRMDLAYAAADLVVCRSGAMTVAEISAVGLPAIYVPLAIGNGEQRLNAGPSLASGGCRIIDNADAPAELIPAVLALMADPAARDEMSRSALAIGEANADDALVDMVLEAAKSKPGADN